MPLASTTFLPPWLCLPASLVFPALVALGAVLLALVVDGLVDGLASVVAEVALDAAGLASVVVEVVLQAVVATVRATANSDREVAFCKGEKNFMKEESESGLGGICSILSGSG